MNKREFMDRVCSELARVTKSLANPHRLEIIELLAQGVFSIEQIADQTNPSQGSCPHKTRNLFFEYTEGQLLLYGIQPTKKR